MEGQTGVWLLAALLVAALMSAEAQNTPRYFEVGGKLVLEPKPVSGPLTVIVWKLKGGIVGEWADGTQPLDYSPKFKGRASLNTATGVLEISNTKESDVGLYTVEINNMVQDKSYNAIAIKQVPKPVVILVPVSCNEESESCVLICDGDITGAEPVSFYWEKGDGQWEKEEQNMTITKETRDIEKFSCQMKNPLGVKNSESVKNPFYNAKLSPGAIGGISVVVVVGVAVGFFLGVRWCRYHHNKKKNNSGTDNADSPAASPPQNNGNKPNETLLKETNHESSVTP